MDYELVDVPVVESLDDPTWGWAFHGLERLETITSQARYGNEDLAQTGAEFLAEYKDQLHNRRILIVGVRDAERVPGSVVGLGWLDLRLDSNLDRAEISVEVDPSWEATSLADDLLARVEGAAQAHGRTTFMLFAPYGPADEGKETLAAPGGETVPANAFAIEWARRHGYVVGQAERQSVLDLPMDDVTSSSLWEEAPSLHDGYSLHVWDDGVPAQWLTECALLRSRFDALAPSGDFDAEGEVWDEQRVIGRDERVRQQGDFSLQIAVEHIETGELVGYTNLIYPMAVQHCAYQGITLVLPEHRGHRIGLWMKLANLDELRRRHPEILRLYTSNAAENEHMLSINRRMGFRPFGGTAIMKKTA